MNHNQAPSQEAFQHQEFVQFNDGRIALGFKTPGDVVRWDDHKYTDVSFGTGLAIVSTEGGKRIAVGNGITVLLPELDRKTGKFGEVSDEVQASKFEDVSPQGLPDVEIGKPWIADSEDPVKDVLIDYKVGPQSMADEQVDMPNPFDSARAHISRVDEAMAQGDYSWRS
jgi:hypothetical protein